MTKRARVVLQDAKASADELRKAESGLQDASTNRRSLVATMALLRAVGNVLNEVDGQTSDALREAIDHKWKQSKPLIFTDFIESYRGAVLKRYEQPEIEFDTDMGTLYPRLCLEYGGRTGVSLNYLVAEAIQYWEDYLDDVDELARKHGGGL